MYNQLIAINKPTGLTSSDVVVKVKRILSKTLNEKVKVGHMGTLDPGAAGVLLLGVNKATRLFDYFLLKSKKYVGQLTFGTSTDTLDSYGKTVSTSNLPKFEDVIESINNFIGEIEQIPPQYSAIKINGQKAYQLARKGEPIHFKSRHVNIYDIKCIRYQLKEDRLLSIDLEVTCSSGTYIRTLFNDIAQSVNCDGYMSYLIRTSLHNIDITNSITLQELENKPLDYFIDPLSIIKDFIQIYNLNDNEFVMLQSGRSIKINNNDEYIAMIYQNELKFIAKNINGVCKSVTNLE